MSRIDEKQELENYQNEVLNKAFETMSGDDIVYIEEDLRSFCTQEMAVFRAFADIVDQVEDAVVIIDTAPTGHILRLLDATESLLYGPHLRMRRLIAQKSKMGI